MPTIPTATASSRTCAQQRAGLARAGGPGGGVRRRRRGAGGGRLAARDRRARDPPRQPHQDPRRGAAWRIRQPDSRLRLGAGRQHARRRGDGGQHHLAGHGGQARIPGAARRARRPMRGGHRSGLHARSKPASCAMPAPTAAPSSMGWACCCTRPSPASSAGSAPAPRSTRRVRQAVLGRMSAAPFRHRPDRLDRHGQIDHRGDVRRGRRRSGTPMPRCIGSTQRAARRLPAHCARSAPRRSRTARVRPRPALQPGFRPNPTNLRRLEAIVHPLVAADRARFPRRDPRPISSCSTSRCCSKAADRRELDLHRSSSRPRPSCSARASSHGRA